MVPGRRRLLVGALVAAGVVTFPAVQVHSAANLSVANVTGLYTVTVQRIETPGSTQEVADLVKGWHGKIAVGGGRYSMGGQVAVTGGLHLDMRGMNRLVWVRPEVRAIRVQAGMRWRDVQDVLDPLGLAVKTMQSYSNFTVGGAVSVNAHGRYVGHGPIANTVRALQLVLADGTVLELNRQDKHPLFRAALGGYGAAGIITEVELDITDNVRIERVVQTVALDSYVAWFDKEILADPDAVLHNADLAPPLFDTPIGTTWRKTDKPLTVTARLTPRSQQYALEHLALWSVTELPGKDTLRKSVITPLRNSGKVVQWLNHEASADVGILEPPSRRLSTYVLQEYFVPPRNFVPFVRGMAALLRQHRVNAVNVSIRHAGADGTSLLPWASEEVFALVLFYKQGTSAKDCDAVGLWTRALIDLALQHEGRYYLPYQLHATQTQFDAAYPEAAALRQIKARHDPAGRLSNQMWDKYL